MEKQDLERRTEGRKPSRLKKLLVGGLAGLTLGLVSLVGGYGCAGKDFATFTRNIGKFTEKPYINFMIVDKDGIKKAYIVDNQGRIVNSLRKYFEPPYFEPPRNKGNMIGDISIPPEELGLNLNGDYTLVYEDKKENVTKTPLTDWKNRD